jgi:hypothetical protein
VIDIFSSFAENLLRVRIDEIGGTLRMHEDGRGSNTTGLVTVQWKRKLNFNYKWQDDEKKIKN